MAYQNNDIINKKYQSCGCIISSELDVLENIIQDKYLQLCKNHYNKHDEKYNFKYDKKSKNYILSKITKVNEVKKNKLSMNKSYENLKNLFNKNKNQINSCNQLLHFGKYKNKTYEYVYYNDKIYCYNLAFWNSQKDYKNKNIINFITFIKNQVELETE